MEVSKPKVIAIVGPTASGKTALSIALAQRFRGEVISADSRQVYKGMDLGSGKVTTEEMAGIPHHLLDIANPVTDTYTGADFVRNASQAITTITERGHLPIIAGGTFFYLDLLRGLRQSAPVVPNPELRDELEANSTAELSAALTRLDPQRAATIDHDNRRRLIRALEIVASLGQVPPVSPTDCPYDILMLGIDVPIPTLNERIYTRIISRLDVGMLEEIAALNTSGVSFEKMAGFGLEYRVIGKHLQGQLNREDMIEELAAKTRQYARRQRLWLKQDPTIKWLPFPVDIEAAATIVQTFLHSNH